MTHGEPRILYNDIDPFVCAVLRERIAEGWISGDVVERDVRDMQPADVVGYGRVHLFAGIGAGELACQLAEWPDNWSLWTGGFPCQDASSANPTGGGIHGERTGLYREFVRLAAAQRPLWIVAENVGGLVSRGIDIVLGDFEREGYAGWPLVVGAAEAGAPHLRDRLWLVFRDRHADGEQQGSIGRVPNGTLAEHVGVIAGAADEHPETLAHADRSEPSHRNGRPLRPRAATRDAERRGRIEALADTSSAGLSPSEQSERRIAGKAAANEWRSASKRGWWRTEPDVGRVAYGVPSRVDRLRSLGNAQVPLVLASVLVGIQRAVELEHSTT